MTQRIDLHTHTFLSDGALLPSEHLRRFVALDHAAVAITDHADASNLDELIEQLRRLLHSQGFLPLAAPRQSQPQIVQRNGIVRLETQNNPVLFLGFIEATFLLKNNRQIEATFAITRMDRYGTLK